MKNFMITPGSSTSQMEQRSSDHIVPDVNDDNIDNGQCHHFSISGYVREMQMNDSNFCSLSDDHINSSLVTTKAFLRWYCKSCRDKLEPLYNNNRTPASMLKEFARGPEHDIRKELSQEKGSAECRSPSSYNKESMKVDRAVNDSYESTPINQENGSAKCHSPSWANKESSDAIPVLNDTGLDEASPTNTDGTTNILSNVNFLDDTNPPDTRQKIAEKKEINNKVKLGFLHGEPMLKRSNKDNSMKTLPVKRHNIEKKAFKTYKRRKNTKVHDVINNSYFVDCQDRSENNRACNNKEKYAISTIQPHAGLLCPGACPSDGNIPYATNTMDGDENIQNNGVYQTPCSCENELEYSKMCFSKVSPGNSKPTNRNTTENEEDECVIHSCSSQFRPRMQCMDSTFAHALPSSSSYMSEKAAQMKIEPRNQSALNLFQVNGFRSILDTEARNMFDPSMSGPSTGHYTRDHMQGRHLHGSIDLWKHTCFTQCEVSTGNLTNHCLLPNSYHSHDQYDVENFISYSDNNINESFAPTMDISAKYQHPQSFSEPFRPVPRIGVLSPMLQKEVTTYSESCGTQSGYRLGMPEEETPCQMYRGENLASSSQKFPASCNPQHLGYVTSVAIPELLSERENSHSTKGKSKMVDSSDKSAEQDICALSLSLSGVAINAATRGRSSKLHGEGV